MSRYIDADELINRLDTDEYGMRLPKAVVGLTKVLLEDAPSIDLVFCEDCRDCVEKGTGTDCPSGYGYLYCTRKKTVVNEDDYCSWGERR